MIIRIELAEGEQLPQHYPQFLAGSGPYYEKRFREPVPPIELRLEKGGREYELEGGFWMLR